jgi:hypothetical protein
MGWGWTRVNRVGPEWTKLDECGWARMDRVGPEWIWLGQNGQGLTTVDRVKQE